MPDLSLRITRRRDLFGSFSWLVVEVQLWSQSLMLSPSDADCQLVLWEKDKGNTGQPCPVITCGSQGFPHLTASGHRPYGIDFQEIRKKRGRRLLFGEPGPVSLYSVAHSCLQSDIRFGFETKTLMLQEGGQLAPGASGTKWHSRNWNLKPSTQPTFEHV